ncbi:MAG: hypothetical protein CTY31_00845 [Hyphomicrobium sp.]|nr:MAG: hypothetical protein CTY39_07510 [Hyphomicrobium sp.]PPD01364.1 MAG: hypothetical protein CTY31_00845 [Hyphomicrobium sp.]
MALFVAVIVMIAPKQISFEAIKSGNLPFMLQCIAELIAPFTPHVDLVIAAAAEKLTFPIAAACVLPHIIIVAAAMSAAAYV